MTRAATGRVQPGRSVHLLPLTVLAALDLLLVRRLLAPGRMPAGVDSAFLYSELAFFQRHGIHAFTGWLPDPFGQPQQYSIYWLLAAVNGIFHSPTGLYAAAVLATILLASASAYGLAYWVSGSALGAALAAGLYVFAPFSLAQWLAGHLNVGISYALGPLALWLLSVALRRGSRAAMVGLGLTGSGLYLLTTGQGYYWLLGLVGVVIAEIVVARAAIRPLLGRVLVTLATSVAVFVAASAVQLIPLAAGVKAPFVEGGTRYFIQSLDVHAKYSKPIAQSVLGVPAEDWTTGHVAISLAPFSSVVFQLLASALLIVALTAVATRRRWSVVAILVPTALAWLVAAGPNGPIGPLYRLLYHHLPYFSLLRVPNRWLMLVTLGIALLIAIRISTARGRSHDGSEPWYRPPRALLALSVGYLGAALGAFGVLHGLPASKPPKSFAAAYGELSGARTDGRVLTTPFWQAWMPSGRYANSQLSITADLGLTSKTWNGLAVVGRGGWDPRASRFADYLYDLTKQGTTTSLPKLLGAAGVQFVGINPQAADEVVGDQNPFFERQRGLQPIIRRGPVSIYRNRWFLPQAFVLTKSCVVAGGMHVLGDLADQTSFDFRRTGILFADQIANVEGRRALRRSLSSRSACLIVAPGGQRELAVLLGAAETRDALDFASPAWTSSQTRPIIDLGADPSIAVDVPPGGVLSGSLRAPHGGRYSLWVAALRAPGKPPLEIYIDGRRAGRVALAATGEAIRWQASGLRQLSAGRHRFQLRSPAGRHGDAIQITRVALMPRAASRFSLESFRGGRLIREEGGIGPIAPSPIGAGRLALRGGWRPDSPLSGVRTTSSSRGDVEIQVPRAGRRYFTLIRAPARGVDPARPLAIRFRGAASGQTFYLNALFGSRTSSTAAFRFLDDTKVERTVLFSPLQPSFVNTVPDWSRVSGFTISTNSKRALPSPVRVSGPFQPAVPQLAPRFRETHGSGTPYPAGQRARSVLSPADQEIGDRADLGHKVGPGLLVLTQAYHPGWQLEPRAARHTVALGFANAYRLRRPVTDAQLRFVPATYGVVGTWLSLAVWLTALTGLGAHVVRRRRRALATQAPASRAVADKGPPAQAPQTHRGAQPTGPPPPPTVARGRARGRVRKATGAAGLLVLAASRLRRRKR